MTSDREWMARALQLARRGLYTTRPNPCVGCVLVRDDTVVGQGWHARAGEAHAEVMALQQAGEKARGATAYVTLEPCCHQGRTPPCTQALIDAGVARVVTAMLDPNPLVGGKGLGVLQAAGMETTTGVLDQEARSLNRGFCSRMERGRPWVTLKLAMSLDGRTAAADGSSQWITGPAAREDGHRLRARAGAVLTGIGTVLADDPQLTVRLEEAADWPQPQRLVLDSALRLPVQARMLSLPGRTTVLTRVESSAASAALREAGAEVVSLPDPDGQVDLKASLIWLAEQEINEVLIEAGATLSGAFVQAGLVDELVVYMAPTLLGDAGRGLLALPDLRNMADQRPLALTDMRPIGKDWRMTLIPQG